MRTHHEAGVRAPYAYTGQRNAPLDAVGGEIRHYPRVGFSQLQLTVSAPAGALGG
jgi:hypothetical protein